MKFLGFATPRSGTAWLSNFLCHGESSFCRHEALYGCDSINGFISSIDSLDTPVKGSIDTAAGVIAPTLAAQLRPLGYRFFVVLRPADDVRKSLKTISCSDESMPAVWAGLHWLVKNVPNVPVIQYKHLFQHDTLRALWQYLEIPAPFPVQRLEMLREILVEDGRIKGFGRFATDEGCEEAKEMFGQLVTEAYMPPHLRPAYEPKAVM